MEDAQAFSEASEDTEVPGEVAMTEQQEEQSGSEEEEGAGSDDVGEDEEDDKLLSKAQRLMEKVTSSQDNPNPNVLHALASVLETEDSRYLADTLDISADNGRASHSIGRLATFIRDNDEFFELVSSTFLSETSYSISVKAAAVRLLLSCSVTWTHPHLFEENVIENIKAWAMDDSISHNDDIIGQDCPNQKISDSEMLRTYSTGLLAVCLSVGGSIVEDVLTSGLPAKLMQYLRSCVLGETSTSHSDASCVTGIKSAAHPSVRGKDDSRYRVRQLSETPHSDDTRFINQGPVGSQGVRRDHDRSVGRHASGERSFISDIEPFDDMGNMVDFCEEEGEERWCADEDQSWKVKLGDEALRDESRRRGNRGCFRSRSKGCINDGGGYEQPLTSPLSGNLFEKTCNFQDPSSSNDLDVTFGSRISLALANNDIQSYDCMVGTKDISNFIIKAVSAAEAEATAANGHPDAVKAAGDAAAEVVKNAAVEEYETTNDEEASVLAASRAASTVIDAANAIEVSRTSEGLAADSIKSKDADLESGEDFDVFFIPDEQALAQIREKCCIQCLEILGEYVEVLGPVLHEKGVDVCLALLHRDSSFQESSGVGFLLPNVLKLICALAAHRKFAAVFVDRGGMAKLLAVPRVSQTYLGLSSCLFTIGSLQGIMERVCALPSDVIHQVVELALQLLECPQDQARKNAALFFGASFVFRAVIDAFDSQDGLQKLLNLLGTAASVRSGANSGAVGLPSLASRNERSSIEVLTSVEKQIAFHTCVALRQYFRAHLLLLVDSIRPNRNSRSAARNIPPVRAAYKPLDISNEAMEAILLQLQKDRKLGPAFVRTPWPAVDMFLGSNGHIIMLELCQAPPDERYLRDLLQYALGVLHIVTLVPYGRKLILNATLSNNRVGIAVILDAASCASYVEPEIIQPALNILVNLVCPPPSISNKPATITQGHQLTSGHTASNLPADREMNVSYKSAACNISSASNSAVASVLVGDRRISLGAGAGCAGLAAQLEQGYCQAREAVRVNNGIKVLLHLLQPRIVSPPATLDCLRALACRVLLGLARDGTIAHVLTKLQIGKKLSELIRDSGHQITTEQGRWQAELAQVAFELIGIVTNSGKASALAASDAATPTLRRIERAAIAAATPISYHSRELLLLIHEHLQASGLTSAAAALLKEAQLIPLSSTGTNSTITYPNITQESTAIYPWPSGRTTAFLSGKLKPKDEDFSSKFEPGILSLKRRPAVSSTTAAANHDPGTPSSKCVGMLSKSTSLGVESQYKTPTVLPMKRKAIESKDVVSMSSSKRQNTGDLLFLSPNFRRTAQSSNQLAVSSVQARLNDEDNAASVFASQSQMGPLSESNQLNSERLTLDSLVVQYLKHQHRQCPAPITTLPPLSLLHPHLCPEPKRSLDAPSNVAARLDTREFRRSYGGMHGYRKDRQFVYSRFRPWRTCREDNVLLSCVTFMGNSARVVTGCDSGELKIFDSESCNVLESYAGHHSSVTMVQSFLSGESQFLLSSSSSDVQLWDATSVSTGPAHSFDQCKAARFDNSGSVFAALPAEQACRDILIYDIQTCNLETKLSDAASTSMGAGRTHSHPLVHFCPSDMLLLWNGVLWDRRSSAIVHRFEQFTDYGGGGFHPGGNEVIINSEVWDLRKLRLLRSVPSLDQTLITFNASGDVIYAILRRNLEDVSAAVHTRRVKHPLFSAFRTVDAINYSEIATVSVDRCVLDFATEPTNSFVGLVTLDDQGDMFSSLRVHEIGRRRPTDDDSDPDDAESEEEDDDDEEEDEDEDEDVPILAAGFGGDIEVHDISDDEDEDNSDDSGVDVDGVEDGIIEIVTGEDDSDDDEDDDDDSDMVESLSSDEDFVDNHGGF